MSIEKIKVATGLYWVEIKEIDLKILCATPADCVKHLMRKGFNQQTESNGVTYESGPNTILLSDIPLQNGQLSNLAEFPILQMFYRQGMLIPNHPNSKIKPTIIGTQQQLTSQMNYIYRGNYGLVTREEISEACNKKDMIDELMRIKLKFAFGNITNPNKLLNSIVVEGSDKKEIRDGAYIKRLGCNKFEISYKDDSVQIDLNLKQNEQYETPYELNYFDIKREFFAVIHSGQGDGWNTSQPCMSSIIIYEGKIYLIDAGPNTEYILEALGIGISEIEGIFHTHSHDDHFAGLANLIKSDKKIKYYATKLVKESVVKKFSALLNIEDFYFDHYFDVVELEFDKYNSINGLEVMPMLSPHPVETNIFMFRTLWEDGYKTYAHYADLTSFEVMNKMFSNGDDVVSQSLMNKIKLNYLATADVKKVDIGGGMIHGLSCDFKDDKSETIILSHTSNGFSTSDKEIGSTASFGALNVLIPARINYDVKSAYMYLTKYHKDLPTHIIDTFSNLDIVKFNPGTIIQKKDTKVEYIYIILSGIAEAIYSDEKQSTITSGNLIGRMSGLLEHTATETVRSVSYVKALKIPSRMFLKVIQEYNLYPNLEQKMDKMLFLNKCRLFNEDITYPVLDNITNYMCIKNYEAGSKFTLLNDGYLYIVSSGKLNMTLGDKVVKELSSGDFFGEENAIFGMESAFSIEATTHVTLYTIDSIVLKDIPIVKWKLFEQYKKKEEIILSYDDIYNWDSDFRVGVQSMDIQYEKIFILLNSLNAITKISDKQERKTKAIAITTTLIEYIKHHVSEEERLLEQYEYEHMLVHKVSHKNMIDSLILFIEEFKMDSNIDTDKVISTFYNLLTTHIKDQDKFYGEFLNSKGIY
jgi:hemerythrin